MEEEPKTSYWTNYYHKNKEVIIARNKKWREENKEKTKEEYKKYWEAKSADIKARRKEKIECKICDCQVTRESLTRHKNSKKHLENITKLNSPPINIECQSKILMED